MLHNPDEYAIVAQRSQRPTETFGTHACAPPHVSLLEEHSMSIQSSFVDVKNYQNLTKFVLTNKCTHIFLIGFETKTPYSDVYENVTDALT